MGITQRHFITGYVLAIFEQFNFLFNSEPIQWSGRTYWFRNNKWRRKINMQKDEKSEIEEQWLFVWW